MINYNLEHIRNVASECENVSNDILSSGSKSFGFCEQVGCFSGIKALIDDSCEGVVKDLVGQVAEKTVKCIQNKSLLVSTTANFVKEIAFFVEEQDREISKKIGG